MALGSANGCEVECESGWNVEGDRCFFFASKNLTWVEAEKSCRQMGSHLASVTDQQTQDFLNNQPMSLWIGATYDFNKKQWKWTDNSTWGFIAWRETIYEDTGADQNCAFTGGETGQGWGVMNCEEQMFQFVCAKPAVCNINDSRSGKSIKSRINSSNDVNISNNNYGSGTTIVLVLVSLGLILGLMER